MIILPNVDLGQPIPVFWALIYLLTALFYAFEGNYVAKWGTAGLDPVEVMLGASVIGVIVTLPLALFSGQWIDPRGPWGVPDYAFVTSSVIHAFVYTGYIWIVGRAGAVFAAQVSYLVTGFGVLWAILILDESYSGWVWSAMGVMMIGMFLVQPRRDAAEPLEASGKTGEAG